MTADATELLVAALDAEHMVIYGYGVLGTHLDDAGKAEARKAESAHRDRRDALIEMLSAANVPAPPAAPAYRLTEPVSDGASALRLAVSLEETAARAWRAALAATADDDRRITLDALIACAIQAMRWREAAGLTPVTVPFPGTPQ